MTERAVCLLLAAGIVFLVLTNCRADTNGYYSTPSPGPQVGAPRCAGASC